MKKIILLVLVILTAISFAEASVVDTAGEKSLKEVVYQYKTLILNEYQSDPETALIFYSSDVELSNVVSQYIEKVPKDLWSYPDEVVALAFGSKDSFIISGNTILADKWVEAWPFVTFYSINCKKVYRVANETNYYSSRIIKENSEFVYVFVFILLIFLPCLFALEETWTCSWRTSKKVSCALVITALVVLSIFGMFGFIETGLVVSAHLIIIILVGYPIILLINKIREVKKIKEIEKNDKETEEIDKK